MTEIPDKGLSLSVDKSLLEIKAVSVKGELYKIVFGTKVIKTFSTTEALDTEDNMILYSKEKFAGEPFSRYTKKTLSFEYDTKLELKDSETSFQTKDFIDYKMEALIIDYQIVPTIDKGPMAFRTIAHPVINIKEKGFPDEVVAEKDPKDPKQPPNSGKTMEVSNLKINITNIKEISGSM